MVPSFLSTLQRVMTPESNFHHSIRNQLKSMYSTTKTTEFRIILIIFFLLKIELHLWCLSNLRREFQLGLLLKTEHACNYIRRKTAS